MRRKQLPAPIMTLWSFDQLEESESWDGCYVQVMYLRLEFLAAVVMMCWRQSWDSNHAAQQLCSQLGLRLRVSRGSPVQREQRLVLYHARESKASHDFQNALRTKHPGTPNYLWHWANNNQRCSHVSNRIPELCAKLEKCAGRSICILIAAHVMPGRSYLKFRWRLARWRQVKGLREEYNTEVCLRYLVQDQGNPTGVCSGSCTAQFRSRKYTRILP